MSLVVFICNAESPDDAHTLKCLKQAQAMHSVLFNMQEWLISTADSNGNSGHSEVLTELAVFMADAGVSLE